VKIRSLTFFAVNVQQSKALQRGSISSLCSCVALRRGLDTDAAETAVRTLSHPLQSLPNPAFPDPMTMSPYAHKDMHRKIWQQYISSYIRTTFIFTYSLVYMQQFTFNTRISDCITLSVKSRSQRL